MPALLRQDDHNTNVRVYIHAERGTKHYRILFSRNLAVHGDMSDISVTCEYIYIYIYIYIYTYIGHIRIHS